MWSGVKPPEQVRERGFGRRSGRIPSFNLKRSSRCRPAAGSAGPRIRDNHKLQDRQARVRHRRWGGRPATVWLPGECSSGMIRGSDLLLPVRAGRVSTF
jgi:hypothetical protein